MTPEERAVIESADRLRTFTVITPSGDWAMPMRHSKWGETFVAFLRSVDALRASRQPKPRYEWVGYELSYLVRDRIGGADIAKCGTQKHADLIVNALNALDAAEPK